MRLAQSSGEWPGSSTGRVDELDLALGGRVEDVGASMLEEASERVARGFRLGKDPVVGTRSVFVNNGAREVVCGFGGGGISSAAVR